MKTDFMYMGRHVKITMNDAKDAADISIDGKTFKAHLHTEGEPEDNYIKLWMCEDGYNMTASPEIMAKNFVRYWHRYE